MSDSPGVAEIRAKFDCLAESCHYCRERRVLLRALDEARAEIERLRDALLRPYEVGRKYWDRHSTPLSQSWDFLPADKRRVYILQALAEIAGFASPLDGAQPHTTLRDEIYK